MGAKVIVQDPRVTPVARTCDLFLPVKPGRDAAVFAGVLNRMIEKGWIDRAFIDNETVGFEQVAEYCRQWTLERTAEVSGVPARSLEQAAEWWGTATSSFIFHARGIEHHSNGVQNSLGTINLVLASGRIGDLQRNGRRGLLQVPRQAHGLRRVLPVERLIAPELIVAIARRALIPGERRRREQIRVGRCRLRRRELLNRLEMIEDPDRAAVRRQNHRVVARMQSDLVDAHRRQVGLDALPLPAAVE
jgi:anaerobic selenocysteine-containing dehydrogenase